MSGLLVSAAVLSNQSGDSCGSASDRAIPHWIDETVVLRVSGSVERHEDQWILPTVSIPLIPVIAFFWERLGVERDAAMGVLRESIAEAMRAKVHESPGLPSQITTKLGRNRPCPNSVHPKAIVERTW